MSPNPPFAHLTYKSAAVSIRSSSDLTSPRARTRRLPFPRDNLQRSVTTLGATSIPRPADQRTLSASALPPRTSRPPKRLFRPIQEDVPRRTRSANKPSSKPSFSRITPKPKARSRTITAPSLRQHQRTIYHSTTASARAAELTRKRKPEDALLTEAREGGDRHVREGAELCSVPVREGRKGEGSDTSIRSVGVDSAASSRRGARIVVKRRLIRGTSVFRPATESELEEFLQRERYREMVSCVEAAVNVPPLLPNSKPLLFEDLVESEREVCAQCLNPMVPTRKAGMGRRGVRRVSSLLSKHLGLDGDGDGEHMLDVSEMVAMDECTAVAVFLKEIRKCRRDMLLSLQDKAMGERGAYDGERKEVKKVSKERKHAKREGMEKVVRMMSERRSLSADDPALMRALIRQEHLLSTHASNRKRKGMPNTAVGDQGKIGNQKQDVFANNFDRERSYSELALRLGDKRDEPWKRVTNHGRSESNGRGKGGGRGLTVVENVRNESGIKSDSAAEKGGTAETEDEDEGGGNDIRILTAIEPVDPSLGLEEEDVRRGTSYHMGTGGTHGYAGSRRRMLARGVHGGESGLLRRLRSLRRRTAERK